ncbi:MAG: hypothetical protein L0226_06615 [Acidobacteria bacterium]|nr:hypothetical protein [Acidobacteriota bacterium]
MPIFENQRTHLMSPGRLSSSLCIFFFAVLPALAQSQSGYNVPQKIRRFHNAEEFARLTEGRVKLYRSAPRDALSRYQFKRPFPNYEITVIADDVTKKDAELLWIGTKYGLFNYHLPTHSIQYFAGKRWLPDDQVVAIGFEEHKTGSFAVWVETPKGFSCIEYKQMTLAEKAKAFENRVRARHVRHGLTAGSHLRIPGDLSSNQMVSSDNDGLWTAIYVAAECFRYKVTGEADAREFARQGIQAIMRLEEITGIPGFPARSFIKIGVDEQPRDGEWHMTPDGQWRWKGDTSSDEIVGHYFVYPIYYDLVADDDEKKKIRAVVMRITNHILDNGYQLIDTDGKRTTWGWWGPGTIWEDPDETGLRALHILSHLRVAIHITGNPKFQAAYNDLIDKHRYHLLTRNQKINIPTRINHSDDELAFLSYYPLLLYEKDPKLREIYIQSLERSWLVERPERNPLWNFIYAAGSSSQDFDRVASIRTLREIPVDLVAWTVTNSQRLDVPIDPLSDRFKHRQSLTVLPYDELPAMKWNGNPYRIDGGSDGRGEDDGAFFLLPYWMGRYHKLIDE